MPRKKEILLYQFDELNARAKERARDWYREGALEHEWWEHIYEDAKNIGLKITGFDLGRGSSVDGKLTKSADDVARLILKDHGKDTETYKDAEAFLQDIEKEVAKKKKRNAELYSDADEIDEDEIVDEAVEELEEEFRKVLCEDYRIILQNEMEYLTSDEQVDESILANEYEFNEDGSRA